mgnify:CR=1 FL=1
MLHQSIYDHLVSLCDEYYLLQEQVQDIVVKFNTSMDDVARDNLRKELASTNDEIENVSKSFMGEVKQSVDDICNGVNDSIAGYMKQKVLSPIDVSSDASKYNRINRLKELDEYVDALK